MFIVDTVKLEVGRPLRVDLMMLDGRLLAKAGAQVTEELKSDWIERGISKVCSYHDSDFDDLPPLLKPYDPALVRRLEANISNAADTVLEQSKRIRRNETVDRAGLDRFTEDLLSDIDIDIAAVLAIAFGESLGVTSGDDRAIAHRSSQLSLLSMAIGTEMGLSDDDRRILGIAGLLHDISLMKITGEAVQFISGHLPAHDPYLDHPLASAYLLESVLGLEKRICMAVAHVHEQPGGYGFPQGLPAHRVVPISRVLCAADAYLTLTARWQPAPFPQGRSLQPCDAVAYLMHHATQKRFDSAVVNALIRSNSLYPIGSRVELSDQSTAVVLRSTRTNPLKPVVRIDDHSFSTIDLRNSSLTIVQPANVHGDAILSRLTKSGLGDVLF